RLGAAREVRGKHRGVGLAGALEPGAGEAVAQGTVLVGEHGVGRVAEEAVAEAELGLAGEARARACGDDLARPELAEPVLERLRQRAAKERLEAAGPEDL